ncbi:Tetratricopeptide repeat-containing protein [bacterium A37T11]|nr:Tetratricopeptide repeat-containing protein [bacterium A37T11]
MSDRLNKLLVFLKESPQDPFILYAIATEYLRLERLEEALHSYEKLLQHHPEYVGTYYHLGKLYETLNRKAEAIACYEQGIKVARSKRDMHALSELQAVYLSVTGLYEDDDDF